MKNTLKLSIVAAFALAGTVGACSNDSEPQSNPGTGGGITVTPNSAIPITKLDTCLDDTSCIAKAAKITCASVDRATCIRPTTAAGLCQYFVSTATNATCPCYDREVQLCNTIGPLGVPSGAGYQRCSIVSAVPPVTQWETKCNPIAYLASAGGSTAAGGASASAGAGGFAGIAGGT